MADADLYDTDILAWSEQQAAALRALATRRDLPNDLDLSHVLEEIEDVGINELNAMKSFIRLIFVHVIKCRADTEAPSVPHWHEEIGNFQAELSGRLTASMRQRIDLEKLWRQAVRQASLGLRPHGHTDPALTTRLGLLGAPCPFDLNDLSADPSDLVTRLETGLRAV